MIPAAAVNMTTPKIEKPIDVLHPTVSPKRRAMTKIPVMMMKP